MATPKDDLERRVDRNTNDIEAIYDILTDHGVRLASIEALLVAHSRTLTEIKGKLGAHDARFDSHDTRFDSHDARFDSHDARFDAHDARFDSHDARFDAHDARFDAHDARFDAIDATLAEILRRLPEAS